MIDKLYRVLFFERIKAVYNSAMILEADVNNYIKAVPRWYGLATSKVFLPPSRHLPAIPAIDPRREGRGLIVDRLSMSAISLTRREFSVIA